MDNKMIGSRPGQRSSLSHDDEELLFEYCYYTASKQTSR
jgi:hypothetical protein